MTYLHVKSIASDKNDETLYKSKTITLDAKRISTPIVSLDARLITHKEQTATATRGLNEIYRRVGTKNTPLRSLVFDRRRQDSFNSELGLSVTELILQKR